MGYRDNQIYFKLKNGDEFVKNVSRLKTFYQLKNEINSLPISKLNKIDFVIFIDLDRKKGEKYKVNETYLSKYSLRDSDLNYLIKRINMGSLCGIEKL